MERSVLVVVLAGTGWIRQEVASSMLAVAQDRRFAVKAMTLQRHPVSSARNHARKLALEEGFDYLVLVDDDNPPPHNLLDLCLLGLDVVGAPTPIWAPVQVGRRPFYFNALVAEDRQESLDELGVGYGWRPVQDVREIPPEGLVEVDALGGGCLVLSRHALEAVRAPFAETFNEDGIVVTSEDYEACRRWKAAGLRIWAHFHYVCGHLKEIDLLQAIHHFARARVAQEETP